MPSVLLLIRIYVTFAFVAVLPAAAATIAPPIVPLAEQVNFMSADGATTLIGYLFKPEQSRSSPAPAVVMMHGRTGAYSSLARGNYGAATLTRNHQHWGHLWAQQGYAALLVDGFSPRGYPTGFSHASYNQRPESVNEVTVRPLDAYGALAWLRKRSDILPDRIALQGWSNGGSATLATMAAVREADVPAPIPPTGFRGAIAFYPGCGLKGQFKNGLVPYAPVWIFQGTADEEVSPSRCSALVDKSRSHNGDIQIVFYPGATHGFDDPAEKRRSVQANDLATEDAIQRAVAFFAKLLR